MRAEGSEGQGLVNAKKGRTIVGIEGGRKGRVFRLQRQDPAGTEKRSRYEQRRHSGSTSH
jgi:hypothetical protein